MTRAALEIEAQALEPGQSIRMVCPFCGGGNSRERSLSLTHAEDGALLFHCYRANCSAAGVLGGRSLVHTRLPEKPSRVKGNIEHEMETLPENWVLWGMDAWTMYSYGVDWHSTTGRLALPLWGPTGILRGRVLRVSPGDTRQPKTLTWLYEDAPVLSWWGPDTETVVVVEDIPSAMRISLCGKRAVALNGTHMTDESIEELDRNATDVVWALDPDAVEKGHRWMMATRMYFRNSCVLHIDKDFKDMTHEEAERWLSEISWLRSSSPETPSTESADS